MRIWKSVVQQWFGVTLFAGACISFNAWAQDVWVPIGPPPWTNTTLRTVGGITYFTHTSWLLDWCRVASGPISWEGTNLVQFINEEEWTGNHVPEPSYHSETHVSVLGALPPGDYQFWVLSGIPLGPPPWFPPWPSPVSTLFATIGFSVPTPQTPTLSSWVNTNAATFNLSVAGVSNVTYVIQASDTLINWTSLATNTGAPFVWSEPLQPAVSNRFYRTWIIGN